MYGTRSPQTNDERGARCARRIRIRLAAVPWSTASRGVPSLDLFPLRPFITVADRRATTGNLLPAASSNRHRTTSGRRCCAPGEVRRATGREASSRGTVKRSECGRRGHPGTQPRFIESGPFAGRVDLASIPPTSLVRVRCPSTVRRHLKAKKAKARPLVQDGAVTPGVQLRPVSDRARAENLPWRSNDVGRLSRTWRIGRGEQVSRCRATVSNGGERAEGKKVEGRDTLATMNVDRWLAA